jgi:hypothetical protein
MDAIRGEVLRPASRALTVCETAQIRTSASQIVAMPCSDVASIRIETVPARKSIGVSRFDFASEKNGAAEQLVIGILNPARAQILIGEIMHMLEDRKPRHQARRQGRMSGLVGINRAEPLLEEVPVDRPAELGQRVVQVDDLIEPRTEEIVLPAVSPLLGPHRITLRQADGWTESRPNSPINLPKTKPAAAALLQM